MMNLQVEIIEQLMDDNRSLEWVIEFVGTIDDEPWKTVEGMIHLDLLYFELNQKRIDTWRTREIIKDRKLDGSVIVQITDKAGKMI